MWIEYSNRNHLLEIVGGKTSQHNGYHSDRLPIDQITGDEFYLIWENEPKQAWTQFFSDTQRHFIDLPSIIVIGDDYLRDFFAWSTVFLPGFRPLSAYCRIMDISMAKRVQNYVGMPSLGGFDTVFIGLIIAESLASMPEVNDITSISPVACASTLSYCLSRTIALGGVKDDIINIVNRWLISRNLTTQPSRSIPIEIIINIFWLLALIKDNRGHLKNIINNEKTDEVSQACIELIHKGIISNQTWLNLTKGSMELRDAQNHMRGPREDRVIAFQSYISEISYLKVLNKQDKAFLCGYLANLIAPGSMEHIDIIKKYSNELSDSVIWYGFCSGIYPENELLSSFNVLGRRLLRSLLKQESILQLPEADLALDELQVMLATYNQPIGFRTFSPSIMQVELQAGISTFTRPAKRDLRGKRDISYDMMELEIMGRYINEMNQALTKIEQSYKRLGRTTSIHDDAINYKGDIEAKRHPKRKPQD